MKIICNDKKNGFLCADNYIEVRDKTGKVFYFKRSKKPTRFNLPEGIFYSDNNLKSVKPFQHNYAPLPPYEKDNPFPNSLKIIIEPNPHKCSIITGKNLIILDPQIARLPRFIVTFIIGHELGHYKYYTEKYCDLFARNLMLRNGYNYSQTTIAPLVTLSSCERVKHILKKNNDSQKSF